MLGALLWNGLLYGTNPKTVGGCHYGAILLLIKVGGLTSSLWPSSHSTTPQSTNRSAFHYMHVPLL